MRGHILYPIILVFLVLAGKLIYDYLLRWKKGKPINHPKEAGIVGGLLTVAALIFWLEIPSKYYQLITKETALRAWISFVLCWLMVGFSFWTLFDGLFNIIRRYHWNFTGSVDPDDAKLDILQRKYKWLWVAKIIISAGLLIVYLKFI